MSKIYEALLRAELDREDLPADEPDSAQVGSSNLAAEGLNAKAKPAVIPAPDRRVTRVLGDIAVRSWSPMLAKLPALQARGHAAEQFRSLRSRLYEYRGFETLRSVLVSSGLPQEGKSFVAANLALSLARYKDNKVLLIDGDLRRSSLHTLLGCPQQPGLSDYLAGRLGAIAVLQRPEVSDDVNGLLALPWPRHLSFISGGKGGDAVFDLSGNKLFEELMAFVTPHFDWVIIDSSPVNLVADAVNLAPSCDGVLLVARSGVTKYETLQRAQSELKASKILGVVLNGATEAASDNSYYGYQSDPE